MRQPAVTVRKNPGKESSCASGFKNLSSPVGGAIRMAIRRLVYVRANVAKWANAMPRERPKTTADQNF